ncbi:MULTISPECIES: GTP cyclohydrolase II [unclassified Methylophilus]|jgi:GTP cyclohydrolase II|uniref:GTP cyclohydrolase II n=1 Tax=unclassified Methylophilus TaxID=2630143 RepID=UPI000647C2D0|nr:MULTISPECIES: GTP cyclohydrolase II [unclassified Methylophilus]HCU83793.1 GTP cyclohydrolase II [Methylophilus sp.]
MPSSNLALKPAVTSLQALITPKASANLPTEYGTYRLHAFEDNRTGIEHIALVLGDVAGHTSVLTRLHSECLTGDVFGSQRCDCGEQFKQAQRLIQQQGRGVILYLRGHEGRGIGLANKIRAYALQEQGLDTVEANLALNLPVDQREYDIAAAMLQHLQVASIRLLSNNPDKSQSLAADGIIVETIVPLEIPSHPHNAEYLATKKHKLGHQLALVSGTGAST